MESAINILVAFVETARTGVHTEPAVVVTLNPEMVMRSRRDAGFRAVLESAALLVPDGIGIVRALRRRGHHTAQRVGGSDMLTAYLPHAERLGHRLAMVGAAAGVAQEAARRLTATYPGLLVVAAESSDPDAALAARLRSARAEMVWAAYGHGAQEQFLHRHLAAIGAAAGVGVGGSLDYFAGRVRRAPRVLQQAGLEWAWRLARQPWRIRRQAVLPAYWWLERREALRRRPARRLPGA